jgi:hypothetical protein
MPRTEIGDRMREVLRDYHEYVDYGYGGPVYVKPAMYSSYPNYAFVVTPFKRWGKQFMVQKHPSTQLWIFEEIPF